MNVFASQNDAFWPWLGLESSEADPSQQRWHRRYAIGAGRILHMGIKSHNQPLERAIDLARETIQRHMEESLGRMESGHRIDGFLLNHRIDRCSLRMDLEGQIIGVGPRPPHDDPLKAYAHWYFLTPPT